MSVAVHPLLRRLLRGARPAARIARAFGDSAHALDALLVDLRAHPLLDDSVLRAFGDVPRVDVLDAALGRAAAPPPAPSRGAVAGAGSGESPSRTRRSPGAAGAARTRASSARIDALLAAAAPGRAGPAGPPAGAAGRAPSGGALDVGLDCPADAGEATRDSTPPGGTGRVAPARRRGAGAGPASAIGRVAARRALEARARSAGVGDALPGRVTAAPVGRVPAGDPFSGLEPGSDTLRAARVDGAPESSGVDTVPGYSSGQFSGQFSGQSSGKTSGQSSRAAVTQTAFARLDVLSGIVLRRQAAQRGNGDGGGLSPIAAPTRDDAPAHRHAHTPPRGGALRRFATQVRDGIAPTAGLPSAGHGTPGSARPVPRGMPDPGAPYPVSGALAGNWPGDDLAQALGDILRSEARRHGIDVDGGEP